MSSLRRNNLQTQTEAENAIGNAIREVEKMGADTSLTEITMVLLRVKEMVGDYVDKRKMVEYHKGLADKQRDLDHSMPMKFKARDVNDLFLQSKFEDNNVVITLPVELLAFACKERQDGCEWEVTDLDTFGREVASRIINEIRPEEDGSTMFYRLLDACFDSIYEDGIECYDHNKEFNKHIGSKHII